MQIAFSYRRESAAVVLSLCSDRVSNSSWLSKRTRFQIHWQIIRANKSALIDTTSLGIAGYHARETADEANRLRSEIMRFLCSMHRRRNDRETRDCIY